jgi:hypothetical protein
VYLDVGDLGWRPYVLSWLAKRKTTLAAIVQAEMKGEEAARVQRRVEEIVTETTETLTRYAAPSQLFFSLVAEDET